MNQPENDASVESSMRDVPIDWEALENAFENNAPEVHSYLQIITGDVLRIVDGVADPQMHARIAADNKYLRVDAVTSREQYRWMERYIPTVEDPSLRARLEFAIDGKGAFRRFKDVLMSFAAERERWFVYRSERLRTFMEAWLEAHNIKSVPRVRWLSASEQAEGQLSPDQLIRSVRDQHSEVYRSHESTSLRRLLRALADTLSVRDLVTLIAFAEFLQSRAEVGSYAPRGDQFDAQSGFGYDPLHGSDDDADLYPPDLDSESDGIEADEFERADAAYHHDDAVQRGDGLKDAKEIDERNQLYESRRTSLCNQASKRDDDDTSDRGALRESSVQISETPRVGDESIGLTGQNSVFSNGTADGSPNR